MATDRQLTLLDHLREAELLEPAQLDELTRLPEAQDVNPAALGKVILQRGWLTRFQVNSVANGRGKDLLVGPYLLLDRLGEGGMGQVYKAKHRHMSRVVALKVIRKEKLAHPDAVKRFYQEVTAAAQLSHPNIVMAYDAGQAGGTHYLAMELVDGIDLARLVKEQGPLPVATACDYVRQAALGLQHAHERGMVHRDIKPHNLLVTATGDRPSAIGQSSGPTAVVKILDMGLARLQGAGDKDRALTQTGAVIGTPDYLSPEQAVNSRMADIRSDLYSLGCTLYFLLTGEPPFRADSLTQVLLLHQMQEAVPLGKKRPETPAGVQAIVRKLMAKQREDRYQTPAEAAAALESFCRAGGAVTAAPAARKPARDASVNEGFTLSGDEDRERPARGSVSTDRTVEWTDDDDEGSRKGRRSKPRALAKPRNDGSQRLLIILGAVGGGVLLLAVLIGALVLLLHSGKDRPTPPVVGPPVAVRDKPVDPLEKKPPVDPIEKKPPVDPIEKKPPVDPGPRPLPPDPNLAIGELRRFSGHTDRVTSVAFVPDGTRLVSGGADNTVRVWQVGTGKEEKSFPHQAAITGVVVSLDGGRALACDAGGRMGYWDLTPKGLNASQHITRGPVNGVAISPDGAWGLFAYSDGNLQMWGLSGPVDGVQNRGIGGRWKDLRCVAWSPDNRHILFGAEEGNLYYYDAHSRKQLHKLTGHAGPILSVGFSAGTKLVASGGADGTVRLWDITAGREAQAWVGHQGAVNGVALSPDGSRVLSGSQDGTARLWDVASGKTIERLRGHVGPVNSVAFSPDGEMAVTAGDDRTVRLWDLSKTGAVVANPPAPGKGEVRRIDKLTNSVQRLAVSPDGRRFLAGLSNGHLLLFDLETGQQLRRLVEGNESARSVAYLPDGRQALSGSSDKLLRLWDVETGQSLRQLGSHGSPVAGLAVSKDGRLAATGSGTSERRDGQMVYVDCVARVWDLQTGKQLARHEGLGRMISRMAFTPDARRVFFLDAGFTACLFEADTGKEVRRFPVPNAGSLAMLPDGKHAVLGGADGNVQLWDIEGGRLVRRLGKHDGMVSTVAVSPDGQLVVAAGGGNHSKDGKVVYLDCAVRVWEVATGRQVCAFDGHTKTVFAVAFCPDGRHVLSGGEDNTIRLWKLPGPGVP